MSNSLPLQEENAPEDHLDRAESAKGYERADLDDAFRRYLPAARPATEPMKRTEKG